MKWFWEIDYHGSRAYGAEEPRVPQSSLTRLVNFARRALRKPTPPVVLLHDGQHSFSLLGLDSSAVSSGRPAECPFPIKADTHDNRSFRVFP